MSDAEIQSVRRRRRRPSPSNEPPEAQHGTLRLALLAALLVPPVLLLGGVHRPIQHGLLGFASASALLLLALQRQSVRWHPVLLVGLGFTLASLLQLLPLPGLGAVSPNTAAAFAEVDRIFGLPRTPRISLDVDATRQAALRWWLVTVQCFVLLQLLGDRRARHLVPRLLLGSALFTVVVGCAQVLLGTDAIYGLIEPRAPNASAGVGGPFIGSNQAGFFMLLAGCACLGYLGEAGRKPAPYLIAFSLCLVGILATGARGALLALLVGTVVFAVRARRSRRAAVAIPIAFAAAALVSLSRPEVQAFFDLEQLGGLLDWSKLRLWGLGFDLVGAFPTAGLGADALGAVQVALAPLERPTRLVYIESDWLQPLLDFGIPLTALITGAAIWLARRTASSQRQRWSGWLVLMPAALAALTTFTLPVPAIAIWVVALFLATSGHQRSFPTAAAHRLALGLAIAALTPLLMVAAVADDGPSDRRETWDLVRSAPLDGRRIWAAAVAGWRTLTAAERNSLAERSAELAGNDAALLDALGRYWLRQNDVDRAWRLFDRISELGADRPEWLREWLRTGDLEAISSSDTDRAARVLEALHRDERYADLLQVALALPDAPLTHLYRIRAALGLGERDLARGLAERLLDEPIPDQSPACRFHAEGLAAGDRIDAAMAAMAVCIEHTPEDPGQIETYLRWSLSSEAAAAATRAHADAYLDRLNALVPNGAARQRYYAWLAMTQARDGECRAAALSAALSSTPGNPRRFAAWLETRCPELHGD